MLKAATFFAVINCKILNLIIFIVVLKSAYLLYYYAADLFFTEFVRFVLSKHILMLWSLPYHVLFKIL